MRLAFTIPSHCCAPVLFKNPGGALIAAIAPSCGKISRSNSGSKCEAQRHVAWTTVFARSAPRAVLMVM